MIEKLRPIVEITKARLREFYREPGALFWVFGFPVLMAMVLGIAFSHRPPEKPRVAIVKTDHAGWLEKALTGDDVVYRTLKKSEAELSLRKGDVDVIARSDAPFEVTYLFDPARDQSRVARLVVDNAVQRSQGRKDLVETEDKAPSERGSRYIDYLIPGIIGLNVMGSSMWGVGYSLVLARRRRVLRRLAATPMRRSHFLLGYILYRLIFLTWEITALLIFSYVAFGVSPIGSLAGVISLAVLGTLAFTGMSLLVAARIESLEAANGWLNFLMIPSWLLSGTFFAYTRFPEFMHKPIQALPLTALNDSMRAVFNEGAGLIELWPQMAVLAFWAAVSFVIALKTFRWQ
jgi:ABC-type multidrug transport system permease subunit